MKYDEILADMASHNAKTARIALQQQKGLANTCSTAGHVYDSYTEHCIWCLEPREKIENAKS